MVLSHYSHLWAISQRVRRPAPIGQRALVAAPLYHMNGLAMCQTTFSHGDTVVLLPQFTSRATSRRRRQASRRLPDLGADHDRDDAARARAAAAARSLGRRGRAHGLRARYPSLIDQVHAVFPKAVVSNGYGTTEAGPVVFGPHPEGLPQPSSRPAIRIPRSNSASCATDRKCRTRRAPDEVRRADDALSQAAGQDREVMTPDGYITAPATFFRRDANGFFYFVGRVDDMFVCGGARTSTRRREKMLGTAIPASTRRP